MRWPWARKSRYEKKLADLVSSCKDRIDEAERERDAAEATLERIRTPHPLIRAGAKGEETHPGLFPSDDKATTLWDLHPGADAAWIPVGPFSLLGREYSEGFVLARRPIEPTDPRPEMPVTLWEGFDLVETPDEPDLG